MALKKKKIAELESEVARFRSHSVMLNSVSWRILNLMGVVAEGEQIKEVTSTPLSLLEEYAVQNEVAIATLQASIERLTKENERLRGLIRETMMDK